MLTPSKLDPSYKTELERKRKDPASFGMDIPLPDEKRDLSGSGLTADRGKPATESEKLRAFLDQPIHDITAQLAAMYTDQLDALHTAETAGKARPVLLKAIEKQLTLQTNRR